MKKMTYTPNLFKILVVDDDPMILKFHEIILKQAGFLYKTANNGKQALAELQEDQYDLILLDVMMPGMDGFEVCRNIKQDDKTFNIPVIFATAKADSESVTRGFEVGGQDYITKPINKKVLLARIKTHLTLKIHNDQLNAMNKKLDEKVKERTRELQEANEVVVSKKEEVQAYANRLHNSNLKLDTKNKELSQAIEELEKLKIGKKATTYAIIVALILFFVSEAILDPYIDRTTSNIFYSLVIKGMIALLFKPIEMLMEFALEKRTIFNLKNKQKYNLEYN